VSAASRLRTLAAATLERLSMVGADPRDDEDMRVHKALLFLISLLILPIALVWGTLYLALGAQSGYLAYLYFVVVLVALGVFAWNRDFVFLLRVQQLAIVLAPTISMIPLGGFLPSGGVGLWGILAPLGALVFSDARSGVRWFIAFIAVFLGSGILGEAIGGPGVLPDWFLSTMLALNVVVGGSIVFTLLALFAKQRQDALVELRIEQGKAENLLLNILPRSIAEKLKNRSEPIADQFSSASILFADVADFTPFAERLPPAEVVGTLDHLFSHFDALAERYGLEKIKTIGDCYMVAAGVPTSRPDHARALALMALEMIEAMRTRDGVGHLGLELRIGINSGPVVAGVIGRKRFLYDLWGDAVNVASRMESQGTTGRIQITSETKDMLGDEFEFERRGTISVKGKGEMEVWYLVGRKPDPSNTEARLADRPGEAGPAARHAVSPARMP
jgi:guanylate cyclase